METINNLVKERLLIVGGSGFIGSYVAKEAVSRGFQVSIISRNDISINRKLDNIEYLSVDISKYDDLLEKLKDRSFHHVINLGGYVDHVNYFEGGDRVFDVHFNGARNLAHCVNKPSLKKFIQIGSSDEYGNNSAPQDESQRESPISPYSFAKTATTHFLQMLHRTEKFPVIILRLFLVYGPRQDNNRFIPQIIQGCLSKKKFPVSNGEQLRDFCFISDIVNAIFASIDSSEAHGEVINIASGEPVTIRDVIIKIQNIIGSGVPQFGDIEYRVGENMALYANIDKAKKILNWNSSTNLQKGIERTIKWYLSE
jgi:nucleoside-diphosphate-sugar epimerase